MLLNPNAGRAWLRTRIALVLCCVLLLVFGATVQIAHVHTGQAHPGCALCATAHVAVSLAAPIVTSFAATHTATAVFELQPVFCPLLSTLLALHTTPTRGRCHFLSKSPHISTEQASGASVCTPFQDIWSCCYLLCLYCRQPRACPRKLLLAPLPVPLPTLQVRLCQALRSPLKTR